MKVLWLPEGSSNEGYYPAQFLKILLSKHHIKLITAKTTDEAWEMLTKQPTDFNLFITGVMLVPTGNILSDREEACHFGREAGIFLLMKLRQAKVYIPVIFVSLVTDRDIIAKCNNMPDAVLLGRLPLDMDKILKTVLNKLQVGEN